jgi:predicted ATPase/DNA-binding SARP family transcriptional activator
MTDLQRKIDQGTGLTESCLSLQLFGVFALQVQNRNTRLSRTARWLLALLALRQAAAISREWLADALWPEATPERALFYLRRTLAELRAALGTERCRLVSPTRSILRVDLSGAVCDVTTFDRLVANADEASQQEAIALYTGDLLADCDLEWIAGERAIRRERYLTALEVLAQRRMEAGDLTAAAGALQQIVIADPLRETAHRRLLEVLGRAGDYAGVERHYRELRRRLREGLNLEPSAEMIALYRRIQQSAQRQPARAVESQAASNPPLHRLPCPLTSLIGREQDRREVYAALQTARLITLTGPGGVGKTRMAIATAEDARMQYEDGVAFVDLAAVQQGDAITPAIVSTLHIRASDLSAPEALARYLQEKRLLLILDNCEHLAGSCARLCVALLSGCPKLSLLCTSRQPLHIPGEHIRPIMPLALPPDPERGSDLDAYARRLPDYGAAALLLDRVRASAPAFRLTSRNAANVARICRCLDGLPLALELVAARFRSLSPHDIAVRLEAGSKVPASGESGVPRHQTLRAALDCSYELLSEPERTFLAHLGAFAGGWRLDAAEQVAGKDEVLDLLVSLVDQSLVQMQEDEEGVVRYRMLETVRQYARDRLRESGEWDAIHRRHGAHFLHLIEEANTHLGGPDQREWLRRLEAEHDNLRAGLGYSLEADGAAESARQALRLAAAMQNFWDIRGYYAEGRTWLAAALTHSGASASTPERAGALNSIGVMAAMQGDFGAARGFHEEALAIFQGLMHRQGMVNSLHFLGNIATRQGDYGRAKPLYEEVLSVSREVGNRVREATSLNALGLIAMEQREWGLARSRFEESLTVSRAQGNYHLMAITLANLGIVSQNNDPRAAMTYYDQALEIQKMLGDQTGIARTLSNQANLALQAGDLEAATGYIRDSLARYHALKDGHGIAFTFLILAGIADMEGRAERCIRLLGAEQTLRQATGSARTSGTQAEIDAMLARYRQEQGERVVAAWYVAGQNLTREQLIAFALST